jgi:hypothetical protein
MLGASIYTLCALAAIFCAWLLLRAYRASGARLLAWSSLCFALLAVNNVVLVVDLVLLPAVNLFIVRNISALLAIGAMLYGLVCDER